MVIKEFSESLEFLFKAEITPFIWGHAGIGKSSIIKQYANKHGYHFFPLYLGTQSDLGDILGLADFVRDDKGTATATTFATPIWLKNAIEYCENNPESGAILFLDEFNRARRDVLQGMFSLALDKTFHTIKLPKNCYIVAAGNPPTEEYQVTDVNETALMARFAHVKLEPTVDEWVQFAKGKNYNQDIIGFIQEQPALLEDAKNDYKLPVKVDRRSYERLQRLFDVGTPKDLLSKLMQGIIGIERTVAFEKFLENSDKPLTGDEILQGQNLQKVAVWATQEDVKASLLVNSIENLLATFDQRDTNLLSGAEKDNLVNFLLMIPKEIAYNFLSKSLTNNKPSFMDVIKIPNTSSNSPHGDRLMPIVKGVRNKS